MATVTRVLDVDNYLGETPIWSVAEQALWWVNCEGPAELHRFSPGTGEHGKWPMPARVGGFVPKSEGGLLVVLADGLYDFEPASAALTLRLRSPLLPEIYLHECHCDRQGRLWVGAFDHGFLHDRSSARGSYFRLDGTKLTPVIDGISVANGLAFSPDGRTMYAADSPKRQIDAYDLDPATGAISNRRLFVADDKIMIDGAAVDVAGGYWLAVVGSGQLRRYLPDGSLDRIVPLPFSNPTKPAFGGSDLATLYVTSTKMQINPGHPDFAANGGLFALTPGETGIAETPLAQ